MLIFTETKVAFCDIAGISPFNVRQAAEDDDYSSLAATIGPVGLLKPLALHEDANVLWVLDGGRRWRSLALRVAQGLLDPGAKDLPAKVYQGTDAELVEVSTAASLQKALHPVEEFEAFAALESAGMAPETIARDFGLTARRVRQRLALGRLAPKIRAAWRAGEITAEAAQAYCGAEDPAAQEALFDALGSASGAPYVIRNRLRGEAIPSSECRAVFVGLDAYAKAGGRIRETLFDDEALLLDAALLGRLAAEKLKAEGEKIREAEGWGKLHLAGDPDDLDVPDQDPELTDKQHDQLRGIQDAQRAIAASDVSDEAKCDLLRAARAEEKAFWAKAMLRTYSKAQRKGLGILVSIDGRGELSVERGVSVFTPKPRAEAASPSRESYQAAALPSGLPEAFEPIGKAAETVVNEAARAALAGACASVGNFALALLVARLGCAIGWGTATSGLEIHGHSARDFKPKHELLQKVAKLSFAAALEEAANAPLGDLSTAAFELIGGFVDPAKASLDETRRLIATAAKFSDMSSRLRENMDFQAFFKARPRDEAQDAIRAMLGESEAVQAGKLKKPQLAEKAAQTARDKNWLPPVFADVASSIAPDRGDPPAPDPRTTAEAMRDAVEADEAGEFVTFYKTSAVGPTTMMMSIPGVAPESAQTGVALRDIAIAPSDDHARVQVFITERCWRGDIADPTKAKIIFDAYQTFAADKGWPSMAQLPFGKAIAANGIFKRRLMTGVHYLGLALRDAALWTQAAE